MKLPVSIIDRPLDDGVPWIYIMAGAEPGGGEGERVCSIIWLFVSRYRGCAHNKEYDVGDGGGLIDSY